MATFIKLTIAGSDEATYPNMDMATGLTASGFGGATIHFRAGEYVAVNEKPEQIIALLNTPFGADDEPF